MKIASLDVNHFRNFENISIELGPSINLFYGHNGSGKTSLLEAIHYLGLGRSFRTRNINRIIHHNSNHFSIFTQLTEPNGMLLPIGIERKKASSSCQIKIAGKHVNSFVEIAEILPLQFINANSHLLLSSGPLTRRQFLDWGAFHVEPSFYHYWQRASRIIKQRNAHLKQALNYHEISLWDDELENCAVHLHHMRLNYTQKLAPILMQLLEQLLGSQDFIMQYLPGWNTQTELKNLLKAAFGREKQLGYTQQGPHRADWQLKFKSMPAQDILSQGQQKLAVYALRLAQGIVLKEQTSKSSLFLIDDLPSELDFQKRSLIADLIKKLATQVIVTGIEKEGLVDLSGNSTRAFHVERGKITGA